MRMNERAARLTAAHFEFPGAHEPRFDQDGNVIYHDPVSGLPRDGEAPRYSRRRAREAFFECPGAIFPQDLGKPSPMPRQTVDMTRELGERSYIGWWMRQFHRKFAKLYGVKVEASVLRNQGVPLSVALMILVYPDKLGDENG